jgi:hypothetical protein
MADRHALFGQVCKKMMSLKEVFARSSGVRTAPKAAVLITRGVDLILAACICVWAPVSVAGDFGGALKSASSKSVRLGQSYYWYDGDRKRTVWLGSGLVAEFNARPSSRSPLIKAYPRTKAYVGSRGSGTSKTFVRIWQLEQGVTAPDALTQLKSVSVQNGRYSPVFHDGPATTARMRALPGNIIVYFNPDWDQVRVSAWLATKGLEIARHLPIAGNVYVLKTGPGLEALETANSLYESGEVIAAFPNWWQETVTK